MSHADYDGDDNENSTRQYARLKTIVFCILPMCEKTADTYIYLISHKKIQHSMVGVHLYRLLSATLCLTPTGFIYSVALSILY